MEEIRARIRSLGRDAQHDKLPQQPTDDPGGVEDPVVVEAEAEHLGLKTPLVSKPEENGEER